MMHGHATITLTDPTTGQVTDRREEDNLVTDVIKDMMRYNPFGVRDSSGSMHRSVNDACGVLDSLVTQAYGGIVLFGETNTEDAASYWPGPDNPIRAYASMDNTTVTDPMRGTYNTKESGPIAKGYRWVYDWPTDRGNGEIKSISLTHRKTGQQWYGNTLYGDYNNQSLAYAVRPWLFSDTIDSNQRGAGKLYGIVPSPNLSLDCGSCADASGVHTVSASSDGLLTAVEYVPTVKDSLTITITTIPWTPGSFGLSGSSYTLGATVDVQATIPGNWARYTAQSAKYVTDANAYQNLQYVGANWYDGQLHMYKWGGNESGDATITHATITTSGNVTMETITSPVQLSAAQVVKDGSYYTVKSPGAGVVANGYLFAMGWDCERFWRIPLADPSHPVEIPLPTDLTAKDFRDYAGWWKLDAGMPGTPVILWTNDGEDCRRLRGTQWTTTYTSGIYFYDTNDSHNSGKYMADLPAVASYACSCIPYRVGPYLCGIASHGSYKGDDRYGVTLGVGLDLRYLATVNNLTDPVTKTSDRTMKITYTLTEA